VGQRRWDEIRAEAARHLVATWQVRDITVDGVQGTARSTSLDGLSCAP
jgi:hypothetical protein